MAEPRNRDAEYRLRWPKMASKKRHDDAKSVLPHRFEDKWLGIAFHGNKRKPLIDRVLRIRSEMAVSDYFYWSGPHKGERIRNVFKFIRKRQLNYEQTKQHYE